MTRSRDRRASTRYLWASVWLALTLVLCKSFGALILFLTLAPLIIFSSPRRLALVLGAVGLLFLLYPAARAADWIPVDRLISAVRGISQDRSDSLRTRVLNEDTLLARASEKPLTGWGSWGRNRIYDVESGRDLSLTDGYWIMVLGTQGWFGFGAVSVLLAYALLRYLRAKNRIRESDQLTPRMTLYVLIALVLLDALPNASISEVTWLLVGCAWASLSFPIAAGAAIRQPKRLRGHRTLLHASS
jgi:hypothetical protein